MINAEFQKLARKHNRLRKHGTRFPFCCICGEHHWAVRYDLHHFAERKYDPRVIRLCKPCHDKVTDMQKDFPPIPANTEARLARLIAIVRGRMILNDLALETDKELLNWLTGEPLLPPRPMPEAGSDNHG